MTPAANLPIAEGRCDKRTNIFLGATLRFGGRTAAVRVRDLSDHGAQVEGDALPSLNDRVTLERGAVFAEALVAWRTADRCGLSFCTELPVAAWWPGRQVPRTQADVDWTVAEVRAEIAAKRSAAGVTPGVRAVPDAPALVPAQTPSPANAASLPTRVAEQLAHVARMLRSLDEELGLEALIVARHAAGLAYLGHSAALLEQVAGLLQSPDPVAAVGTLADASLRRRLYREAL